MANVRNGNTFYVDSTGDLNTTATKASYIVVTATSANAVVILQDAVSNSNKIRLAVATSGDSETFDFSLRPLYFPGGIAVSTLTNAVACIVVEG